MFKEFKEFAIKGNVVDMAVGIVIGVSFGKIVTSLVNDMLMPPVGLILGNVDFSNLFVDLSGKAYSSVSEAKAAGAATINYGMFLNSMIDFTIVAFALFLIVRIVNRMRRTDEAAPAVAPATKSCPFCLSEIHINATRCPHCTSELKGG